MGQVNREFLERYQKLWEADPESRAFAPLAEAYRQEGKLLEALQVCRQGVHSHPQFAGGWFQIAKIHNDLKQLDKAREALKKAVQLAPENIQAHKMLADLYLAEKQTKEALKAFKMVLLLSPEDIRARRVIERLESLTADEYSPESFEFDLDEVLKNFDDESQGQSSQSSDSSFQLHYLTQKRMSKNAEAQEKEKNRAHTKTVTLVDALLVRNEFLKAQTIIENFSQKWGMTEELERLVVVIESQKDKSTELNAPEIQPIVPPREEQIRQLKLKKLENMLMRLQKYSGTA